MLNKRILTLISLLLFLFLLVGCWPKPNQAPIITSAPITTATVGEAYTYDVNATDPEEDVLTYSLTTKPSGMTMDSATGVISWKPVFAQVGDHAVTVVVSDGDLSVVQNFTIKVSKPSPTPVPVKLTKIVVKPDEMTLFVGGSEPITSVTAHYSDGSTKDIALSACAYSSDNVGIPIHDDGLVEAIAEGTATITVTYKGKKDTIAVTATYLSMEIIADLPTFKVGIETEFTVEVVANSDADETVKFYFTLPAGIIDRDTPFDTLGQYKLELFYEVVGDWLDLGEDATGSESLDVVLGGADGDPLIDEVKDFKATFSKAGTYEITVKVRTHPGDLLLCSKDISAVVIDLVQNTDTGEYYHTIQAAIDDASTLAGHTIEVAAGTYNENITIDKSLTIVSVDGAEVTIINAEPTSFGVLIYGIGTVATFDGFTVENYSRVGILAGSYSLDQDDYPNPSVVHILNNIVLEPISQENNNCIQVGFGTTGTIVGNEVFGAVLETPDYSGSGILVSCSSNVLVSNNYVHDCEGGIQIMGWPVGIKGQGPAEDNIIEYNLAQGNESGIVAQQNAIRTIIRYNDALNNNEGIVSVGWFNLPGYFPSGTEIHYNNIVGNLEYGVKSSTWDEGGPEEVDARANWWGDISGPKAVTNPNGLGDTVSENVIFDPWSESSN